MDMLLTKKTIAKMGSDINSGAGSKVSSFALKQMEKMGWKEGQGLGKNETGMAKHIVVKKRDNNVGLGGSEQVVNLPDNWWHDAFATNLLNMKNKMKGKKTSKKDKNKAIESAPSYDDLFKATGGARLGMRARADQKGKLKRTEGLENNVVTPTSTDAETVSEETNDSDNKEKKSSKKKRKRSSD